MAVHPLASLVSLMAAYEPTRRHRRPDIGLEATMVGSHRATVRELVAMDMPFCRLLHFERETGRSDPCVLVVAPLSGHFGALLRDMLSALLPDHDLFLMEWVDAREVPLAEGSFGLEDNIAYIIDGIRFIGRELHLVALCQSAMPALAATALLAGDRQTDAPRTLTLVSGMIDPRIAPTRIDRLLASRSVRWFERNAIVPVPAPYPGAGRLVYPAMMQHASLMAYLIRHLCSGEELLGKVLHDDGEDPLRHPFLQSFLSVMDLPAPFLLDWIRRVFHEFALPRGRLTWRGLRVSPAAITETALMTIEGEHDDVSAPGQTRIAHELCTGLPDRKRVHHLQPGVGHFGTFHGHTWRTLIMPQIRAFIRTMASAASRP